MDDQPAQGGAALPGGSGGGEGDAADDQFDLGARGDDRRVVPPELEQRTAEPTGDQRRQRRAHRRRAGCTDQRHAAVDGQLPRRLGATEDDPDETVRGTVLGGRPVGQRSGGDRAEHCLVGRLPDHRVAADQGQRGVPGEHGDREVEGGDHPDRTEWVPVLRQAVLGTFAGDR